MAGVFVRDAGSTTNCFYLVIRSTAGQNGTPTVARKIPEFHIKGECRYAVTRTPCCGRRVRVRIVQHAGKWCTENAKRCPRCRQVFRLDVPLTKHGFARSVRFFTIARTH